MRASEGTLSPEGVDKVWPEYSFRLGLEKGLLDTLEAEAKWVSGKGLIKGATADRTKLRSFLARDPIRSLAPETVSGID